MNTNRFFENLKRQAEDNPALALGLGAAVITAASKLIDSLVGAKNARSWDRETRRRERKAR